MPQSREELLFQKDLFLLFVIFLISFIVQGISVGLEINLKPTQVIPLKYDLLDILLAHRVQVYLIREIVGNVNGFFEVIPRVSSVCPNPQHFFHGMCHQFEKHVHAVESVHQLDEHVLQVLEYDNLCSASFIQIIDDLVVRLKFFNPEKLTKKAEIRIVGVNLTA
ncbi:MAG: hypothetical protein CVU67_08105 [Deltaproteobacteria bacterium HGW-Deltaproteobacteria-24]|nr:MAG: hypothetical protein CVU67_08105 [Deltaproteobacteria bacterium HGW-Deltaproteobacteria-24]